MFDWPTKMEKRKTLSPKMQEWYDSDAPGETADILIRDLHMNPENKVALINIVGDTVLGLIPVADLPNQIPNYIAMPLPSAQALAEHLVTLLTQAQILAPTVPIQPNQSPPQPPIATPPPIIPQYQKPLTSVPPYRNANLYQKP